MLAPLLLCGCGGARRARPPAPAGRGPTRALAGFALLRRPERAEDTPTGQALTLVARDGREQRAAGGEPLSVSTARRLPIAGEPAAWALAGPERLCLLSAPPVPSASVPWALSCVSGRAALAGYLMCAFDGLGGGRGFVVGLLPDGARDASLLGPHRLGRRLVVSGGAYAATTLGAASVRFTLDGHEQAVRIPSGS